MSRRRGFFKEWDPNGQLSSERGSEEKVLKLTVAVSSCSDLSDGVYPDAITPRTRLSSLRLLTRPLATGAAEHSHVQCVALLDWSLSGELRTIFDAHKLKKSGNLLPVAVMLQYLEEALGFEPIHKKGLAIRKAHDKKEAKLMGTLRRRQKPKRKSKERAIVSMRPVLSAKDLRLDQVLDGVKYACSALPSERLPLAPIIIPATGCRVPLPSLQEVASAPEIGCPLHSHKSIRTKTKKTTSAERRATDGGAAEDWSLPKPRRSRRVMSAADIKYVHSRRGSGLPPPRVPPVARMRGRLDVLSLVGGSPKTKAKARAEAKRITGGSRHHSERRLSDFGLDSDYEKTEELIHRRDSVIWDTIAMSSLLWRGVWPLLFKQTADSGWAVHKSTVTDTHLTFSQLRRLNPRASESLLTLAEYSGRALKSLPRAEAIFAALFGLTCVLQNARAQLHAILETWQLAESSESLLYSPPKCGLRSAALKAGYSYESDSTMSPLSGCVAANAPKLTLALSTGVPPPVPAQRRFVVELQKDYRHEMALFVDEMKAHKLKLKSEAKSRRKKKRKKKRKKEESVADESELPVAVDFLTAAPLCSDSPSPTTDFWLAQSSSLAAYWKLPPELVAIIVDYTFDDLRPLFANSQALVLTAEYFELSNEDSAESIGASDNWKFQINSLYIFSQLVSNYWAILKLSTERDPKGYRCKSEEALAAMHTRHRDQFVKKQLFKFASVFARFQKFDHLSVLFKCAPSRVPFKSAETGQNLFSELFKHFEHSHRHLSAGSPRAESDVCEHHNIYELFELLSEVKAYAQRHRKFSSMAACIDCEDVRHVLVQNAKLFEPVVRRLNEMGIAIDILPSDYRFLVKP